MKIAPNCWASLVDSLPKGTTVESAVDDIVEFMDGKSDYEMFHFKLE
jgi:hypothetical protein